MFGNSLVSLTVVLLLVGFVVTQVPEEEDADQAHVESEEDTSQPEGRGTFELNLGGDKTDPEADVFVPTKEWQTVKKGQPLPKGLHYRLNLQTGLTEAKLLDETEDERKEKPSAKPSTKHLVATGLEGSETQSSGGDSKLLHMKKSIEDAMQELAEKEGKDDVKYWKQDGKEGMMKLKDSTFTRDELKNALKKFKLSDDNTKEEGAGSENKFRSMEDIKADFAELNVNMKTDTEVLKELLVKYQDESLTEESRIHVLVELEYYLHQIDNAVNFADMGGLHLVIRDLNNTSERVRKEAAFALGSATQSNPKVQVKVVELGALLKLIRMLSTDVSDAVRVRVLFALSCTLRHFPFAQKSFVENGGVQVLTSALSQSTNTKLRLKALTLTVDLLQERAHAELHSNIGKTVEFEKLQQYKNIPLQEAIIDQGWCSLVTSLLDDPQHESREQVLAAMDLLLAPCRPDFSTARRKLDALHTEYSRLAEEEMREDGEEGYFTDILKQVSRIIERLKSSEDLSKRIEL